MAINQLTQSSPSCRSGMGILLTLPSRTGSIFCSPLTPHHTPLYMAVMLVLWAPSLTGEMCSGKSLISLHSAESCTPSKLSKTEHAEQPNWLWNMICSYYRRDAFSFIAATENIGKDGYVLPPRVYTSFSQARQLSIILCRKSIPL